MNDNRLFNPFGDLPEVPDRGGDGNCDVDDGELKVLSAICTFLASVGIIAVMIVLLLLFGSCTTVKYVPVVEHKTDTLIQAKVQRDSVWLHDSIYVHEYMKGDTVFRDHDRWHTKFIESIKHDTTYISKTDSVPQPYPVTEYVEKQLSWWQKALMWMGGLLLLMMIGSLLYVILLRRR